MSDDTPVDNFIFDLGGVFLNLDFDRTAAAFAALGSSNFNALWTPTRQSPFFFAFETGRIDSAAFRLHLRQSLELPRTSDAQLDAAWNAMILDLPQERLDLLTTLRPRYRTFLLSNTNTIHLAHIHAKHGMPDTNPPLVSYFDQAYYSHLIGVRKPEAAAFAAVVTANNLAPERTLFIDDLEENVEAARQIGLLGKHLPPHMPLRALLATWL